MTKHIHCIVGITAFLALVIFYPYFPGRHDPLAGRLSLFVQLLSLASALLLPLAVVWLIYEVTRRPRLEPNGSRADKSYYFGLTALIGWTVLYGLVSLLVFLAESTALAICFVALGGWIVAQLAARLRRLKSTPPDGMNPTPLYLLLIPWVLLGIQWACVTPVTDYSRALAIRNAGEIIDAIERHRAEHGDYPASMNAVWKDYDLHVVGIEKYHYTATENGYSLYFEQPRFLFDDIGVREFVMYNSRDEHVMPSHASWTLIWSTDMLAQNQGWHAAQDTAFPHWKRFLFD